MSDFTERTIAAISDADFRSLDPRQPKVDHTASAINLLSDEGLERLHAWLSSMTRHYPLNGPLWRAHLTVIEALVEDIEIEMATREAESRRESRNGSEPAD